MDLTASFISAAISLLLFFILYSKISQISSKLTAQDNYYKSLDDEKKAAIANENYQRAFGEKKL